MSTMRAAVLRDFNRIAIEDVPLPVPVAPDDVVVRIKSCGICATDYKAIRGVRRNVDFPFIPGHEPSGIVAATGSAVTCFREGDEVILQPSGYCGFCRHCRVGNTHYCESAFTTGGDGPEDVRAGSFAEYTLTSERCLFPKPPGISFDAASQTEPLSGAWKGVVQFSQIQLGDDAVVIGAGAIGMYCALVARAAGAGTVIVIDPSAYARETALQVGVTRALDPGAGDIREMVYDLLPHGPDLVVEAAGPIQAVEMMVRLLRRGTRWNVFGITTPETFSLVGKDAHFLEARMDASFGTTPLAMMKAIQLMEKGLIDTEAVVSHRFALNELDAALAVMAAPDRNKVILHP